MQWATAALRVIKPGGYAFIFGGTRTYHRLACAVEDAGWEIRDCLMWVHGVGFPKSRGCLKPAWESILVAQTPFIQGDGDSTIVESLSVLESQLWSLSPAGTAGKDSNGTPAAPDGGLSSVRPGAERRPALLGDLSALTGTSRFASAVTTCLNIVSSWRATLVGASIGGNTSTIGTASSPTIDWTTLKSCLSAITPQCIIRAEIEAPGSRLNALPAARYLNAACLSIESTRELSALGLAMSEGLISPRDGTDLGASPAYEPILLARRPGPRVLPLGIDGGRVPASDGVPRFVKRGEPSANCYGDALNGSNRTGEIDTTTGRWPANVAHDGSDEVMDAFAAYGEKTSGGGKRRPKPWRSENGADDYERESDSGSAARFFYCSKASQAERCGSRHPTVKPLALMRWLVRLAKGEAESPVILDPFMGSGTTGEACLEELCGFVGIDRDRASYDDARRRLERADSVYPLFPALKESP